MGSLSKVACLRPRHCWALSPLLTPLPSTGCDFMFPLPPPSESVGLSPSSALGLLPLCVCHLPGWPLCRLASAPCHAGGRASIQLPQSETRASCLHCPRLSLQTPSQVRGPAACPDYGASAWGLSPNLSPTAVAKPTLSSHPGVCCDLLTRHRAPVWVSGTPFSTPKVEWARQHRGDHPWVRHLSPPMTRRMEPSFLRWSLVVRLIWLLPTPLAPQTRHSSALSPATPWVFSPRLCGT